MRPQNAAEATGRQALPDRRSCLILRWEEQLLDTVAVVDELLFLCVGMDEDDIGIAAPFPYRQSPRS